MGVKFEEWDWMSVLFATLRQGVSTNEFNKEWYINYCTKGFNINKMHKL